MSHRQLIVSLSCFKLTAPFLNQLVSSVIIAFPEPNVTFLNWIHAFFFPVFFLPACSGRLLFFHLDFSSRPLCRSTNQWICFSSTMRQTLLLCQLAVTFLLARGQNDCIGHSTFRNPGEWMVRIDPSAGLTPPPLCCCFFSHLFSLEALVTVWNFRQPSWKRCYFPSLIQDTRFPVCSS